MKRTLPIVIGLLVALWALPASAKTKVYAGFSPQTIGVGGTSTLKIVVEAPRGDEARFIVPKVTGLKIPPSFPLPQVSVSTVNINGRVSTRRTATYRIKVVGVKAGRRVIQPFSVVVPGEKVAYSPRLELTVRPKKGNGPALATLRAKASSTTLYVGEPLRVDLRLGLLLPYAKNEVTGRRQLLLPTISPSDGLKPLAPAPVDGSMPKLNVWTSGTTQLEMAQDLQRSSRDYDVYETSVRWLPTRPGTFSISEATYSAEVATRVERVRGFFEDCLVASEVQPANAVTAPIEITVRALPTQGRPANFRGLIGRIQQTVSVDRVQVAVGESLKLTRELTGAGNLDLAEPPPIVLPDGFKTFGTLIQREPGRLLQIVDLAPRNADATMIPALELTTFDTRRGVYVTQSSRPIALQVKGGSGDSLALLPGSVSVASDLRGLKLVRARSWHLPSPVQAALSISLPLFLGFLGLAVGRMRRTRAGDAVGIRKRRATHSLQSQIKLLRKMETPKEAAHRCRGLLAQFLADLTDQGVARFASDLTELESEIPPELYVRATAFTDCCDEVVFAGSNAAVEDLIDELAALAPELKKALS